MTLQLLALEYGLEPAGPVEVPRLGGAEQQGAGGGGAGGAPLVVTASLLGCNPRCSLRAAACPVADASQCRGFQVLVSTNASTPPTWMPAAPAVLADGRTLQLSVAVGAGPAATALATSYGRSNWPLVTLYSDGNDLPVLPWCMTLSFVPNAPCSRAGW